VSKVTERPYGRARLIGLAVLVVVVLLIAAVAAWTFWPVTKDLPERVTAPTAPAGTNGLTAEERQQYYHLTEGGELYPMAWLLALEQETSGPDGTRSYRPYLENVERFGMIPDAASLYNPYGLPVGVTIGYSQISGLQMMGLNCTACHVGEIHYNGRAIRIDGGPNMSFVNAFIAGIFDETNKTKNDSARLARFADRRRRVKLVPVPAYPVVEHEDVAYPAGEPNELLDSGLSGRQRLFGGLKAIVTTNRGLVDQRLGALKTMQIVSESMKLGTLDGYGRADAFGVGRNELFGGFHTNEFKAGMNAVPPDAPVSFPHLWGMRHTSWFQWGANTNSVVERNIGQSLGVGALYEPGTYRTTARLDHLYAMETLAYKLTPPKWPEDILGPVDRAKAARGQALFNRTCALCHETYAKIGSLNEYQLFALDVVGTDPSTAVNFERMVMTAEGPRPFGLAAFEVVTKVMNAYFAEHHISEAQQRKWQQIDERGKPDFRVPLRDYEKFPDTKNRGVYRAKTLKGIWATAPYLHNGSVPTIYDLLLPVEQRPKTFKLGTREYDTRKLGYVGDGPRFVTPPNMQPFVLDTHALGNWNTGHEWWFYAQLTDENRYEIIEFLKTFTDEGDYVFERPPASMLSFDVRARQGLAAPAYK
jgi:hypothetical protein